MSVWGRRSGEYDIELGFNERARSIRVKVRTIIAKLLCLAIEAWKSSKFFFSSYSLNLLEYPLLLP